MIDPVNNFILHTNAKCGGTTLKHWFLSAPNFRQFIASPKIAFDHLGVRVFGLTYWKTRYSLARYSRKPDNTNARRFLRYHRRLMNGLDDARLPTRNFILVRTPYDRAVSAFIDKFCGDDRDTPWVRDVVKACGVDSPTFIDFLNYVQRTSPRDLNPHWRQQSHAVQDVSDLTILKLETLEADFERHADVWGNRDKSILTRRHQCNTYNLDLNDMDATHLSAQTLVEIKKERGAFPPKGAFLTPEAKALIATAYQSDFDRFGYPVE